MPQPAIGGADMSHRGKPQAAPAAPQDSTRAAPPRLPPSSPDSTPACAPPLVCERTTVHTTCEAKQTQLLIDNEIEHKIKKEKKESKVGKAQTVLHP